MVSPKWETPIQPGAVLYYVAEHRIDAARLANAR
jgi:hypothetical protein